MPPLDLGDLAVPVPAPEWADFEPEPVRGLRRMFGGQQQYEAAVDAARQEFQEAEEDHRRREDQRSEQVANARRAYQRRVEEAEREVAAHNAHIDEVAAGLSENDRFAVSEYIQAVLDLSPYPAGFPAERSAGYVPESALLAVEWYLPPVERRSGAESVPAHQDPQGHRAGSPAASRDQADLPECHCPDRAPHLARGLRFFPRRDDQHRCLQRAGPCHRPSHRSEDPATPHHTACHAGAVQQTCPG